MSLDSVPKDMRQLRACKLCSMIKVGPLVCIIINSHYVNISHLSFHCSLLTNSCTMVATTVNAT